MTSFPFWAHHFPLLLSPAPGRCLFERALSDSEPLPVSRRPARYAALPSPARLLPSISSPAVHSPLPPSIPASPRSPADVLPCPLYSLQSFYHSVVMTPSPQHGVRRARVSSESATTRHALGKRLSSRPRSLTSFDPSLRLRRPSRRPSQALCTIAFPFLRLPL